MDSGGSAPSETAAIENQVEVEKPDDKDNGNQLPPDAEVVEEEESEHMSPYTGFAAKVDNFFGITREGSSISTEIFAGLTVFLSMCYILVVNPNQLAVSADNPLWPSVFLATCLGAIVGCLMMAFYAKMPLAQAPGMGLNSQVGTLLYWSGKSYTYGNGMLIVFLDACMFMILTIVPAGRDPETGKCINLREKIFDSIPVPLRNAIPVGIGLFITIVGFENAAFIIGNQWTLVQLVDFKTWPKGGVSSQAMVLIMGLLLVALLERYHIKGSVIISILVVTIIGIGLDVTDVDIIAGKGEVTWKFWESFKNYFNMKPEEGGAFLALWTNGTKFPSNSALTVVMTAICFCMIDMFDSIGTIMGCCSRAGLLTKAGKPIRYGKCMLADAVATLTGSFFGTSSVTTFVESGTGVAAGGRTGLVALIVACMFFLSIFLLPIFAMIPTAAAACALIYTGSLMMAGVKNVDFSDIRMAIPSFLTIICMPLAYSITDGIGIGFIFYVLIGFFDWIIGLIIAAVKKEEKPKFPLSVVMIVVFALFVVYFFVPRQ